MNAQSPSSFNYNLIQDNMLTLSYLSEIWTKKVTFHSNQIKTFS